MHKALLKKHLLNFSQQFQERISRFRRWEDVQLTLLGRLLLEKGLKEHASSYNFTQNDLLYTSYGKPYLEDNTIQFNISHSGTIVMCAISKEYEIGVDIEQIIPINPFDFKSQMITNEWESIKNQKDTTKAFYEYWTKKEAVIKADGKGLSLSLKSFEIKEKTCKIEDVLFVIREVPLDKKYKCYVALKIKKSSNNVSFLFNEKIIVNQVCFM